jgi:DNA-binding HxlR family transcriptional regulator
MDHHEPPSSVCPLYHRAVELVGRRWTGAILMVLLQGTTRFTDIVHAVPGLSDRLLSERLKELEAEGIVSRIVHAETPVRIEYRLTEKGRDLSGVAEAVTDWASRWLGSHDSIECDEAPAEVHELAGAALS